MQSPRFLIRVFVFPRGGVWVGHSKVTEIIKVDLGPASVPVLYLLHIHGLLGTIWVGKGCELVIMLFARLYFSVISI